MATEKSQIFFVVKNVTIQRLTYMIIINIIRRKTFKQR